MLPASYFSVVFESLVGKCPGLPTASLGAEHSDHVNASGGERQVAADFLKTLPPEKLAGAGHILKAGVAIWVKGIAFAIRRAGDTQSRIFAELVQHKLEILIVIEGDVGIDVSDHGP